MKNQRSCTVAKFNLNSKALAVVWSNQHIILYVPLLYIYVYLHMYMTLHDHIRWHIMCWFQRHCLKLARSEGRLGRTDRESPIGILYLPARKICTENASLALANQSEQVSPLNIFWACIVVFHCQQNHLIFSTTFSWKVTTSKWMVHWFYYRISQWPIIWPSAIDLVALSCL